MSHVKRVEAQGILSELKQFALEQSEDFRDGRILAVETQKTFHLPRARLVSGDLEQYPSRKSILEFQASRMGDKIRQRPAYVYSLSATALRTIEYIPLTIFEGLDDDVQDELETIDEGMLSESYKMSFETSDYEIGGIDVCHGYTISYRDAIVYSATNMDVVNTYEGYLEDVPPNETTDGSDAFFVSDEIKAERLPGDFDRLINDLAFRAVVDPFCAEPHLGVATFRESVEHMRIIMEGLRTGVHVERLYNLNPPGITVKPKEI